MYAKIISFKKTLVIFGDFNHIFNFKVQKVLEDLLDMCQFYGNYPDVNIIYFGNLFISIKLLK